MLSRAKKRICLPSFIDLKVRNKKFTMNRITAAKNITKLSVCVTLDKHIHGSIDFMIRHIEVRKYNWPIAFPPIKMFQTPMKRCFSPTYSIHEQTGFPALLFLFIYVFHSTSWSFWPGYGQRISHGRHFSHQGSLMHLVTWGFHQQRTCTCQVILV